MQRVDRGPLVLEGHAGAVRAPVTVNQDLVAVVRLHEGPSLGVDVDELLEAPLAGFPVETRDQLCLGGVLIQELGAFDQAHLGDRAVLGRKEEEKSCVVLMKRQNF